LSAAPTSIDVSISNSSLVFGQSETFTATIRSGAGTPNAGTVTFYDGATPINTAAVSSGTATFSTSTLSAGLHVVTATYSGDGANFAGSGSGLEPSSVVNTIAGKSPGYDGDGIDASSASLFAPFGVAVDAAGDLFIADTANHRIREVDATTHLI